MNKRDYIYLTIIISILLILMIISPIYFNPHVQASEAVVIDEPTEISTEQVTEVPTEPSPAFIITADERETIARLVFLEARGEGYECQKAVVSVVINRWMSGQWGNTINSVIYAPKQFSTAKRIKTTTPYQMNYDAVDDVLQNGTTLPYYILYFRAHYHHRWPNYTGYIVMDDTYFGYMNKDKI